MKRILLLAIILAIAIVAFGWRQDFGETAEPAATPTSLPHGVFLPLMIKPEPTATLTPTPSPTPTPTPTPTPIAGLEVLSKGGCESSDWYQAFGEVANNTGATIANLQLWLTFYSQDGTPVYSARTNGAKDVLLPGQHTVFVTIALYPPSGWSRFEAAASDSGGYYAGATPYLVVSDLQEHRRSDGSISWIEGKVTNDTGRTITSVRVQAVFRDENGQFVAAWWDDRRKTMNPGETDSFGLPVNLYCYLTPTRSEVWAVGRYYP